MGGDGLGPGTGNLTPDTSNLGRYGRTGPGGDRRSKGRRLPRSVAPGNGFTLIEIAIVLVIIGLLAGGGTAVLGMLTARKARTESLDYLQTCKEAVVSFAAINGRLPLASAGADGTVSDGDGQASGYLPFLDLETQPVDAYKRVPRFAVNPTLTTDLPATCAALRSGLTGAPSVVDADGAVSAFSVAAVLVGAGPQDADGDGNVFDRISSGTYQGDNTDGNPNYLRHPPTDTFDDLVLYIGGNELYGRICEYLVLAVNNNSASTVYVYNQTAGSDLGSVPGGGPPGRFDVLTGTRIELRTAPHGGGSIVSSVPPTPILLAGRGYTLEVP